MSDSMTLPALLSPEEHARLAEQAADAGMTPEWMAGKILQEKIAEEFEKQARSDSGEPPPLPLDIAIYSQVRKRCSSMLWRCGMALPLKLSRPAPFAGC